MNVRKLTPDQALDKLMSYCSKMERSEYDVRQKLTLWGITGEQAQKIVNKLVEERFINSQRYLYSYVRGKFYYNKWGRVKIRYNLMLRGFKESVIDETFDAFFSTVDYEQMIFDQLQRKNQSLKIDDEYQRKSKLIYFGQTRGYETEISLACVDKIVESKED
ncbi:MAG: RecX family transcriptional regulator [Bacteroidales bacterium]|nr:RecX family transcriptional regulator [Bacteroidales bacterium]